VKSKVSNEKSDQDMDREGSDIIDMIQMQRIRRMEKLQIE
jgi:hypothetical protein